MGMDATGRPSSPRPDGSGAGTGARRQQAIGGKVEGPRKTVEYEEKAWGIPFTTNSQLLCYRKDKVEKPPEDFTWDDMIEAAAEENKSIEVQAAQYEGDVVWVNALIASAGGAWSTRTGT